MDTARRWQVVSVATAIAGLGVGSLLVGRTPSTDIAPIDLDLVVTSTAGDDEPRLLGPLTGSEIVPPVIREDQLEIATASSSDRGGDPVDNPEVISLDTPAASVASPAAPAPTQPAPADVDDSIDSDDSLDSVSD